MPGENIPKVGWKFFIQLDKLAHFSFYAILTGLLVLALNKTRAELRLRELLYIILLSSMYGIMLEAIQYYFLSDRFFEIPDIIANIIGSIAGTVFVYLFLKK